ncbi:MAG TPA: hypothetical protein VH206_14270 [Xanthobacteraceae bacterium]|jgi:HAMP domain-containing protein|nr:hypothetical protein [Xanthobacteraceae bacterium]
MRNSAVFAAAIGLLTFVLGFAYGNILGVQEGFKVHEWQPFGGMLIAIIAAGVAYINVWTTQRISVMTREEERIDKILPGLRQTHDLLNLLLEQTDLSDRLRYHARQVIQDIIRPQDGETYERLVERMVPLADPELRREVTAAVFQLSTQAEMLKVMHEEIQRTQQTLREIDQYAENSRDAVRSIAEKVLISNTKEVTTFLAIRASLRRLDDAIKQRIAEGTERREVIRKVVERYFKQ